MAYLGRALTSGNYLKLDDISSQFNGSTKTFSLTSGGNLFYPGSAFSIQVVLGGVIQEPESAYTINQNQITFASAPGSGDDFFCVVLGTALGIGVPGEGTVSGSKLTEPFDYNSGLLYLDSANNRIGVNSTTPTAALDIVGNVKVSGTITAALTGTATSTTNIPNLTGAITSNNTTTSLGSFSSANLATALTDETGSGSAVFATSPTLVTPVLGAATASSLVVSGISTFTNGPVLVGTGTSTGTASQRLQVTGGAYVSGSVGIGTTNPQAALHVVGSGTTALLVSGNARITGILTVGTSSLTFDGNSNVITGLSTISGSFNFAKPNLSGISSSIASTAVDIFVYDTRKDSDGGAWRKRTQNTSWYNETLNTATRGSRKDFPAVAVIVATADNVTIYDGDDPDMPMWMVFTNSGAVVLNWGTSGTSTPTSIVCLNGILSIGKTVSGCLLFNFVKDNIRLAYMTNPYSLTTGRLITDRNNSNSGNYTTTGDGYVIVNNVINDVAMTVLPNAPIDAATGLPVPTIAVATNGGVSIIKDDGTVVNWLTTVGYIIQVSISKNYEIFAGGGGGVAYYAWYNKTIPTSSSNNSDAIFGTSYSSTSLPRLGNNGNSRVGGKNVFSNDIIYFSEYAGASTNNKLIILNQNTTHFGNSLVAYATTSYNTGWMHGDIKGAWLSDTSTASVTGTELVTNGDFATSTLTSYSQLYNCTLSVVSNQLRVTSTASSGYCEFYISISDTTKAHYFSFQFVAASGITQFGIYAGNTGYVTDANAGWSNSSYTTSRSAGTYTLLIPPGNSTVGFVFAIASVGQTWTFDNISLRKATELDRSVKNRGLAVYGTITKTAVATGSNLVAYSGFSDSNYLQQPYNSALVAGTGSQCAMGWFYGLDANLRYLISIGVSDGDEQFRFGMSTSVIYFDYGGGSQYVEFGSSALPAANTWNFIVATVNAGQVGRIFINGVERTSPSYAVAAPSTFLTNTTYKLTLGANGNSISANSVWNGSIALWRYGLSTPSPTQILKIYNDEKVLFQENSQCTLYGASDAVTALAYDDSNSLLSVGTSSGRSDFRGLARINNTTTAVTTAISASNGLIVEQ